MAEPWWKSAVVYQIYPRSFCDSDGDGVGDLEGIRRHLDHLSWLGVDAVWLSPFFTSPMADFGYDVADYCNVDPLFGTLADFDRLLTACHERGLRVLIDWVPNHTSDQHPWFQESRSDRTNPKRDWYIWRDGRPGGQPPNNWAAAFGGDAWTYDDASGQWYLHLFLPEQPDLNWRNPAVVSAMHDTLRFWLDRGVDGFRIDVVHGLVKHPDLPDVDKDPRTELRAPTRFDEAATLDVVRGVRRVLDEYAGERASVGEVYILSTARVARYYCNGEGLHMCFNFPPLYAPWDATAWRTRIDRVIEELDPLEAWPTWVLSNHDNPRHRTRYGTEDRARAAAVLLLTLRGTPFLYAGEELGLEDAVIPAERAVDPGGRDGCRAPIPWDGSSGHGWAGGPLAWLPWPPEADTVHADALRADTSSILHLYRRLLAARRKSPALQLGSWEPLASPEGVLAYRRRHGQGDERATVVNFLDTTAAVPLAGSWHVELSSAGRNEGLPYSGSLDGSEAVVLRPPR